MTPSIQIPLDPRRRQVLEALRGTAQWGDTIEDVASRLMDQRVWQICGDVLDPSRVGADPNPAAANQLTRPL